MKTIILMKVSPNGVEFSMDDLIKIWNKLSNYINRDKNAICLGLDLINVQIDSWYEDINNKFATWVVNKRVEHLEIIEIVRRAQGASRITSIQKSKAFLENVIERFESRELGRLRDDLDIDKVKRISGYLNAKPSDSFTFTAIGGKQDWMKRVLENQNIDVSEAEWIINWENELKTKKSDINELVMSVQYSVRCDRAGSEELLKCLKGETDNNT